MSERTDALSLARKVLDCPTANLPPVPGAETDSDVIVMLSRQLLRGQQIIDQLKSDLTGQHDAYGDMIASNRDTILKMHEEAVRRVHRLLEQSSRAVTWEETTRLVAIALLTLDRLNTFHPMYAENWAGFPEGSD